MLRDLNRKFIPIRIYQLIFNNENFLPSKNKEFYINFICGLHINKNLINSINLPCFLGSDFVKNNKK